MIFYIMQKCLNHNFRTAALHTKKYLSLIKPRPPFDNYIKMPWQTSWCYFIAELLLQHIWPCFSIFVTAGTKFDFSGRFGTNIRLIAFQKILIRPMLANDDFGLLIYLSTSDHVIIRIWVLRNQLFCALTVACDLFY